MRFQNPFILQSLSALQRRTGKANRRTRFCEFVWAGWRERGWGTLLELVGASVHRCSERSDAAVGVRLRAIRCSPPHGSYAKLVGAEPDKDLAVLRVEVPCACARSLCKRAAHACVRARLRAVRVSSVVAPSCVSLPIARADSIFEHSARSQVEPAIARPISVGLSHGLLVRGRRRAMRQRPQRPAQPCFTLAFLPPARAAVGCVCRSAPCHDHVHGLAGPAPSCTATVGCAVAVPVQRVAHRLSWAHKLTHTHAVAQMVAHARVRRS